MRTAALARQIRRSVRDRVPRRTLRRRFQIFVDNLLAQRLTGIVAAGVSVTAALLLIMVGRLWEDGGPSILTLNALASAASVFLIANVKWVLDRADFPRLDTIATLPWTDRQWLIEFLKRWRTRVGLAAGAVGVTLIAAKLVVLPDRAGGWVLVTFALIAQMAMIVALAFCLANAAGPLARSEYLAKFYRAVLIALLVATVAMVSKRFTAAAVAVAYPQALAVLPTAWPAGILYLASNGLTTEAAFALLGLCFAGAMLIGALALWRLARSFEIYEVVLDPWGRGFIIRQAVWDYYSQWREGEAEAQAGQEFVNEHGDTLDGPSQLPPADDQPPAEPTGSPVSPADGDFKQWRAKRLGRALDDFWKHQGWISDWFSAGEKDRLAFTSLAAGSRETLPEHFRQCLRAMLLVAAVVVIGPLVLDAAARAGGETLLVYGLGVMAYNIASRERDVSGPYRALPISTSQWLWPRLKFQWLRLATVMPLAVLLLSALLWNIGKPIGEILQWIATTVTIAFLLTPVALPIGYFEGCREPWYRLATIIFLIKGLGAVVFLGAGMVLVVMLPWPASLAGFALMAAATWLAWRTICNWYEHGPVDAPGHG